MGDGDRGRLETPSWHHAVVCTNHKPQVQPADHVLVFTLPEEAAVARLVKRGETSGRADDNEDTIRSRMRVFAEESQPVIDALKATGRVTEVDSQGDVDEVFALLVPALQALQDIGVSESSKRLELSV